MVLLIIKKMNTNSSNSNFQNYFKKKFLFIFIIFKRFVRVFEQDAAQEDIFSAVSEPVIDK